MATLTVYPDADVETTSVDGYAGYNDVGISFASLRSAAGNEHSDTAASGLALFIRGSTGGDYNALRRTFLLFDTSALTSGATISAAVLSLFGSAKTNGAGDGDYHIAASTPASNTAIVDADYSQVQTTSFGTVSYSSYSTSAYNNITLNSNGRANISKTGVSKFSGQFNWDINNSTTGLTSSNGVSSSFSHYWADNTGTSNDPKLVVTYTAASSFPPMLKLRQAIKRASFY